MRVFSCALLLLLCTKTFAYADSNGTGFFVRGDGYIVTAAHVVQGCTAITLRQRNYVSTATLIAQHERHDLALLKADNVPGTQQEIAHFREPFVSLKTNKIVYLGGYPGQQQETLTFSWVKTRSGNTDPDSPLNQEKYFQFQNSVLPGNSGGPLLDEWGHVSGVVVGYYEMGHGKTYKKSDVAVTAKRLRYFLQQNGIAPQRDGFASKKHEQQLKEQALSLVLSVRCHHQ